MVAPLIGRAAAIAAAKLLAKKGAKKAIEGGQVANKLPRTASQRPVTGRATSTANRRKSDSLDKVIKQIEYWHPLFTNDFVRAQSRWDEINGDRFIDHT